MTRREMTFLFLAGLVMVSLVACFQTVPGYMDADYYYAGGLRLVRGNGFTETYLWNYLDNPQSLPHPSHGYWFPFASILAAFGMWITGQQAFWAARLGFILVGALVPLVTAWLAYSLTSRREVALISGLLAVFPSYQAPFLPTTDNFGLFMLFGGLFFVLFSPTDKKSILALGLVAGLMNLSRSDGLLWLAVGLFGIFLKLYQNRPSTTSFSRSVLSLFPAYFSFITFFVLGYFLVMIPWFIRNLNVFGTPLTPAGSRVLWMTQYDDTFAYPATRINLQNWLAAGWQSALAGRWWAFKLNFANAFAVQGGILLTPFILLGLWQLRADLRVRLGILVWSGLFVLMTLVFPFAGARGSFIHAGAAFQPLWWAAAPVGLDFLVSKARQRGWFTAAAFHLFRVSLVVAMAALTLSLVYIRVVQTDWAEFDRAYRQTEQILVQNGAAPQDTIVVANSPGYYAITGRSAVTVPAENPVVLRVLAQNFGARFLVLEKNYVPDAFKTVFASPESQPGLKYLAGFDNVRVFAILPGK
jgi:hypothetical protein